MANTKKLSVLVMILALALVLAGCGSNGKGLIETTYTLSVSGDNGSVTKVPDKTAYNKNETVELRAEADPGYSFDHWVGIEGGSTQNPLTLLITNNVVVQAVFTKDATAPTTGSVAGIVTDQSSGNTLKSVTLTLDGASVTSGEGGSYSFPTVAPGTYTLQASFAGYENYSASVEVVAGQETSHNVTLTPLPTTGSLAGKVSDASNGSPLKDVTLTLGEVSVTSGEGGSYSFASVAPGTYTLQASFAGYENYSASVEVVAGQETSHNVALTSVPTTGSLAGTVTDTSGNPVPNVKVYVYYDSSNYWEDTTDESGYYEITGVELGQYQLIATAEGYDLYQHPSAVSIVGGSTQLNIVLTGTGIQYGNVSGTVKDGSGVALANVSVFIYDRLYNETDPTFETVNTDANGKYEFADLRVGEYVVAATSGDNRIQAANVDVLEGANLTDITLVTLARTPLVTQSISVYDETHTSPIAVFEPGRFEIKTSALGTMVDTILYIRDSSGLLVASNDDSYNKPASYIVIDLSPGDYSIEVVGKNGGELTAKLEANLLGN